MPVREKLSVIVGTKNAENDIGDCLESVKWADEIIVIDDFSADKTIDIARKYTDKVFQRKMTGYPEQMDFGVQKSASRWILVLDADERIMPALEEEILEKLSRPTDASGYLLRRLNLVLGREIRHCGWYEKNNIRLFNKEKVNYDLRLKYLVRMRVLGSLGMLDNDLIHHTCRDLYEYFKRVNLWSTLNTEDLIERGFRVNNLNGIFYFFIKPGAIFFQKYVLKAGYRDRFVGFLVSLLSGITYFLTYLKLWRRQSRGPQSTLWKKSWHNDPVMPGEIYYIEKRFQ